MDADTIQSEISRLTTDAKSRRDEAHRLRESATGHRTTGSDDRADADDSQASKLEQDADNLESQARSAESRLDSTLLQIRRIDQQQADLKARYEREMTDLQHQKERLIGGTGALTTRIL